LLFPHPGHDQLIVESLDTLIVPRLCWLEPEKCCVSPLLPFPVPPLALAGAGGAGAFTVAVTVLVTVFVFVTVRVRKSVTGTVRVFTDTAVWSAVTVLVVVPPAATPTTLPRTRPAIPTPTAVHRRCHQGRFGISSGGSDCGRPLLVASTSGCAVCIALPPTPSSGYLSRPRPICIRNDQRAPLLSNVLAMNGRVRPWRIRGEALRQSEAGIRPPARSVSTQWERASARELAASASVVSAGTSSPEFAPLAAASPAFARAALKCSRAWVGGPIKALTA
jgi:hypothetical protein